MRRRVMWVLAAVPAVVAALFAFERTAPGDDAAQYWVMAGRLAATGDPFYVAAVDHKGPLWVWVYRIAYAVSGDQRLFWFVIAAIALALGALIGWAVHRLVRHATGDAAVATAAGLATTTLLWFGPEPYSQVLYSRTITIAMTAVAAVAVVGAIDDPSRRGTWLLVPAGGALGLASTTVLTTVAPAVALATALAFVGVDRRWALRRAVVLGASAAVAFAAVPLWYIARGAGAPFRTYFWDYNRLYASDDAPLIGRVVEAATELVRHHLGHPYLLAGPAAALVVAGWLFGGGLRNADRPVRAGVVLAAWWAGEIVSVSAPGRWFDHYWVLLVVPAVALGGLVAATMRTRCAESGRADGPTRPRLAAAIGSIAVFAVVAMAVPRAVEGATTAASFDGLNAHQAQRWETMSPGLSAVRAATAALTEPGEAVYAWTPFAAIHVIVDRPAASRFDRRTWQTGEIWGSDGRAELPGVWDDLMDDLAVSHPDLIIEMLDEPIPGDSPLADLVASQYRPVFTIEPDYARLYLRESSGTDGPPAELAARDASSADDVRCVSIAATATGEISLAGRAQRVAFDIGPDQVAMVRHGAEDAEPVIGNRSGGDLELRIGPTWVLLREGDHIVAAATLAHGLDEMTTGLDTMPVRCREQLS
ncbi:MAG: hypothetical protein ACE367_23715 [Acidimicrobiales bacterium]